MKRVATLLVLLLLAACDQAQKSPSTDPPLEYTLGFSGELDVAEVCEDRRLEPVCAEMLSIAEVNIVFAGSQTKQQGVAKLISKEDGTLVLRVRLRVRGPKDFVRNDYLFMFERRWEVKSALDSNVLVFERLTKLARYRVTIELREGGGSRVTDVAVSIATLSLGRVP